MTDEKTNAGKDIPIPAAGELAADIASAFEENGIQADGKRIELLAKYLERMLTVNRHLNLTAIRDPHEAVIKHICDSAKAVPHIPKGARVIDVGSGAGLPAVPIAILRPDVTVTALDSTAKKVRFISETADELNIGNLSVITGRAEDYGHDEKYRGCFDAVTARAVARLNILTEICMPFLVKGGVFLALKSRLTEDEVTEAHRAVTALGGKVENVERFILKGTEDAERSVISIRKTASTPARYPRVYTQISSKPL